MFGNKTARKEESELRCERVVVHLTAIEKESIKKIAAAKGMDVSTFIRTVCIYDKFNNFFKGV